MDEKLKDDIKERLDRVDYYSGGTVEHLEEKVEKLQNALAHTMAFIADRLSLTEDEINNADGLTAW